MKWAAECNLHGDVRAENIIHEQMPEIHVVVAEVSGAEHVVCAWKINISGFRMIFESHNTPMRKFIVLIHVTNRNLTSIIRKHRPYISRQLPEHKRGAPPVAGVPALSPKHIRSQKCTGKRRK
jgi:hypothetical protein